MPDNNPPQVNPSSNVGTTPQAPPPTPTLQQSGNAPGVLTGGTSHNVVHSYQTLDIRLPAFRGDPSDLEIWFGNAEHAARAKSTAPPTDLMLITAANNLIDHKDINSPAASYATLGELKGIRTWNEYKNFWRLACSSLSRTDLLGLMLECISIEPNPQEVASAYNARIDKMVNRLQSSLDNSPWYDLAGQNGILVPSLMKLIKITLMSKNLTPEVRQKVFNEPLTPATSSVEFISLVQKHGGFKQASLVFTASSRGNQVQSAGTGTKKKAKKQRSDTTDIASSSQASSPPNNPAKPIVCHHCNQPGHKRPKCPALQASGSSASGQSSTGKYCVIHKSKSHDTSDCKVFQGIASGGVTATGSQVASQTNQQLGNTNRPPNPGVP